MTDRNTLTFAIGAIKRLNARRIGVERFDLWIDLAISQWADFIHEEMRRA